MLGNPLILFAAALIPMLIGAIWYGPLFEKTWMKINGFTKESLEKGNMALILGVSYLLSVVLAAGLAGLAIHQNAIMQLFVTHPDFSTAGSEVHSLYNSLMENYGDRHRNFGHGAVHGVFAAILLALPLLGINALFERRGWKYIGLHFGYWIVSLALMGGVICQWM